MIVVDVNVAAYLLIEGAKSELAREVFQRDSDWVMPGLWRHEFLNVLAMQVQHGGFVLGNAHEVWRTAGEYFSQNERDVDLSAALDFASKYKLTAYDAQYVLLAQELSVELVTEDRELVRKMPKTALSMRDFCAA